MKLWTIGLVVLFVPSVSYGAIRITEVAWMGTVESQYSEWLELYNDGDSAQNLSGWKLVEGSGTTVFTFTKSIGAGEYLLVERTTASAPDAVPGINDESGAFGAGGLANTGEDLILKDTTGTTVDELSFQDGWPAGDATTKDTMQWTGSRWVTAKPTPKAPHEGTGDAGDDTKDPEEKETDPIPTVSPNKATISFSIPKIVYSGVPYEFGAQPTLEFNYKINEGDLWWNMGDGTTIHQNTVGPVSHTYEYPGTYTISYTYADYYRQHPSIQGSTKVKVASPTISVQITPRGDAVILENKSNTPVDLSGWSLIVDSRSIALPKMTIISEKSSATIPLHVFGIARVKVARLMDPSGGTLAPSVDNGSGVEAVVEPVADEDPIDQLGSDLVAEASSAPGEKSSPIQHRTKLLIFGAVALFVIGLSILLERFMAQQEYQKE